MSVSVLADSGAGAALRDGYRPPGNPCKRERTAFPFLQTELASGGCCRRDSTREVLPSLSTWMLEFCMENAGRSIRSHLFSIRRLPRPLNEPDPLEASQLFEATLEKRTRLGPEATLMLLSELGLLRLKTGKLGEAKAVVESGKVAVEDLQVCKSSARRFLEWIVPSLVPW